MKITWASLALILWFTLMVAALLGAVVACARKGGKGVLCGIQMLVGGLLTFGFVSGITGLYEIKNYAQTLPFWRSVIIALLGLYLLFAGLRSLQGKEGRR